MQNFLKNKREIDEHNDEYARGLTTFKMGLNKFSDLSTDEFNSRMYGSIPPSSST